MDFQSAMETFAEAWVAANTKGTPLAEMATQVPPSLSDFLKQNNIFFQRRPAHYVIIICA